MKNSVYIAFAIFTIKSVECHSQHTLQYHPNSPAMIGAGYDPKNPEQIFAVSCIESDGVKNIDTKRGAVEGNIVIKEIKSREELFQAMGASLAIEANYGFVSGSTSISNNVSVAFESTSLIWSATINVNYGRWRLINPRAAKLLIDAPTPSDVSRICGNEIFTQEVRGAIATVIFEMKGLKSDEKNELSQALSFSASGIGAGVDINEKYKNTVNKLQEKSQLSIYVNVQGGPGPSALAPIIQSPSDLNVIRNTLKDYVTNTTPENAKPLSFQTSPISQFKSVQFTQAPDLNQDRLIEIYDQYLNLTALIRRIDELIKPTSLKDKVLLSFVPETKRQELQSVRDLYEKARTELRKAGLECLKSGEGCQMPQISSLPRIDWPDIPDVPKVIGIRKCTGGLLFAVGHQFKKGEHTGFSNFTLALTGNPSLFKSAKLISNDSETPLKVETKEDEAVLKNDPLNKNNPLYEALSQINLSLLDDCHSRTYDETQIFGKINIQVDQKYNTPLGKVEITDLFNRVYIYNLDDYL